MRDDGLLLSGRGLRYSSSLDWSTEHYREAQSDKDRVVRDDGCLLSCEGLHYSYSLDCRTADYSEKRSV